MSRRKNGVRKDWKKKLTELNRINKKLKKKPDNIPLLTSKLKIIESLKGS